MKPGPTDIYKCPKCKNLISRGSLMSGNTIGLKFYSDFMRVARMLPEFPNLTICKKCEKIFLLKRIRRVGRIDWYKDKPIKEAWENADDAEFLTLEENIKALQLRLAKKKTRELYIRTRIWWGYNDRIRICNEFHTRTQDKSAWERCISKLFHSDEDEAFWRENVTRLMALLNVNDIEQRMMLAELNRNLGNFEECQSIIDSVDDKNVNWTKEAYRNKCNEKNTYVFLLNPVNKEGRVKHRRN